MIQLKNPMEIFKLLKKTNCRDCNEKTCLAFAASVFQEKKQLNECPHLDRKVYEKYGVNIEKPLTIEEEQDKVIDTLKQQVCQVDLLEAATRIGGTYTNEKLTLKIFGKDFSINTKATLSSQIHINSWVTIPFLNYILNCEGQKIKEKWIPFRELKNGQTWQGLFGQQCEKPMKKIADEYPNLFEDLMYIFGGQPVDSHRDADIALSLYPFPKIPILICYWQPEDGMPSGLQLFFDATAEENCGIEGIYALGTGLVRMFEKLVLRHGL